MGTAFATAICRGDDSFLTGREAARRALEKLQGKADLAIVFASSGYDYAGVLGGIREAAGDIPLIGCSTAGEFTEEAIGKGNVACAFISSDTHRFITGFGTGLRDNELRCLTDATAAFPEAEDTDGRAHRSCIILMDGLAGKGEEIILAALATLGPDVKITGGGAADDYRFRETSVFSGGTAASDAISTVLTLSRKPVAIGVSHGHTPISPPYTITRASGNKVYELDGKPALEVWLDATREHARSFGIDVDTMRDNPDQLGKYSCIYDGGLRTGEGYKIRWSGLRPDITDHLPFVCTMPEGAVMRVMVGTRDSQIESARDAALKALQNAGGRKIAGAVVFDCAVRGAILGEEFPRAVDEIRKVLGGIPLIGLATYGEIALEEGQLSGFHNTTTVVLLIPE
jgi:methyl-accepting chemotaxis protein